jgi:hypothetical protein
VLYRPTNPSPQPPPDLRHRCRNPRCRTKLPAPVESTRDAFCCRGCHAAYYRNRCLACEREMPRNAEHQKVCYRADCKAAWRRKTIVSRFVGQTTTPVSTPLENPIKPGVKIGLKGGSDPGRPWRQVAGPVMGPRSFTAAIVPDGPGGQWAGGSFERIEAENRKRLEAADLVEIEGGGEFTDSGWSEVASLDGVKCFATRFRTPRVTEEFSAETAALIASIPADLSIPNFLKRTNSAAPATAVDESAPCDGADPDQVSLFTDDVG